MIAALKRYLTFKYCLGLCGCMDRYSRNYCRIAKTNVQSNPPVLSALIPDFVCYGERESQSDGFYNIAALTSYCSIKQVLKVVW